MSGTETELECVELELLGTPIQGPQGVQGQQGETGPEGPAGPTGATGPQGVKGDTGDKGDKGDKGDTGDPAANPNYTWNITTGAAGSNASINVTGLYPNLAIALTIPRGDQGIQGVQGIQGIQGVQGLKGDTGDTGATGATGPKGDQGDPGIPAETPNFTFDVLTGAAGSDAELAVSGVYPNLFLEFTVPQGATGPTGPSTFPDGTVTDPGIIFASDPNTGFYRIGADNIGISTNGTKRVDISNTVTNVTTQLHESGSRVWTAATFDPATKANLNGATFTGLVRLAVATDEKVRLYGSTQPFIAWYDATQTTRWGYIAHTATAMDIANDNAASVVNIRVNGIRAYFNAGGAVVNGTFNVTGDATINGAHAIDRTGTFAYTNYNTAGVASAKNYRVGAGTVGVSNNGFSIRNTTDSINNFYIYDNGNVVIENTQMPQLSFARTTVGAWVIGGANSGGDNSFYLKLNATNAMTMGTDRIAIFHAGVTAQGTLQCDTTALFKATESIRMANASPYLSWYDAAQANRFGYIQHDGTNVTWHNDRTGYLRISHSSGVYSQGSASGFGTTGNLGAGTVAPTAKVHAVTSGSTAIMIDGATHSTYTGLGSALIVTRTDGARTSGIVGIENGGMAVVSREKLSFGTGGGSLYGNTTERMVILSGGQVGIGTSSPSAAFTVSNGGAGGFEVLPTGGIGGGPYINAYNRTTSAFIPLTFYTNGLSFYSNNGAHRSLDVASNGDIGIGAPASYRLDVRGPDGNGALNVARFYQYNTAVNDYHGYQIAIDPTNNWVYHYSVGSNNGGHVWGSSSGKMSLSSDGDLSVELNLSAKGNVTARQNGTNGYVQLIPSSNTANTGYIQFVGGDAVRDGYIGFATTNGAIQYVSENGGGHNFSGGTVAVTGNITATGTITASSDRKLKSEIVNLDPEEELSNIKKLSPKSYIKDGKPDFGLIAQDLQNGSMDRLVSEIDEEGTLGVNYMGMIAPMIAAMQAMADRIEVLENRIANGI